MALLYLQFFICNIPSTSIILSVKDSFSFVIFTMKAPFYVYNILTVKDHSFNIIITMKGPFYFTSNILTMKCPFMSTILTVKDPFYIYNCYYERCIFMSTIFLLWKILPFKMCLTKKGSFYI